MLVLLADRQSKVRFALRVLLEQQDGVKIVGEAGNVEDLLSLLESVCPDLLILSWGLPGMEMDALLKSVRAVCPQIYVVILSERHEREAWRVALAAGADAFASKANPPERLLSIVQGYWNQKGKTASKPSPVPERQVNQENPI